MTDTTVTITLSDSQYPNLLREIHDPPEQLFVRGNLDILTHPYLLAVVGARQANHYGQQCIDRLLTSPVKQGVILVSGLAYGIDSIAHRLSVKLAQPTIAILGSGIDDDSIYPRRHLALAQAILEHNGTVVSELPPGTPPLSGHFPRRNRIIAGLCTTTLVVQAAQRSGSLITARLALESDRDVCAVPGAINDPLAAGCNQLIQNGATPALESKDILETMKLTPVPADHLSSPSSDKEAAKSYNSTLTEPQRTLLHLLSSTPKHIDQIAQESDTPVTNISVTLMELELIEVVQNTGGMKYIKSS